MKDDTPEMRAHRAYMDEKKREYRDIAEHQRARAHHIAKELAAGNPLSSDDARIASRIVSFWDEQLDDEPKGANGAPPTFDHTQLVIDYLTLNLSKGKIAEKYGCSVQYAAELIRDNRAAVCALFAIPPDVKLTKKS